AGAARLEATGGEQDAGRGGLLDELGHLGVQGFVGLVAVGQRHHQVPHGWFLSVGRSRVESLTHSSNRVSDRERYHSLSHGRPSLPESRRLGVPRWRGCPLHGRQTTMTFKVGYFVGSLSSTSINRELSKVLIRLAPDDLEFSEIPIRNLP